MFPQYCVIFCVGATKDFIRTLFGTVVDSRMWAGSKMHEVKLTRTKLITDKSGMRLKSPWHMRSVSHKLTTWTISSSVCVSYSRDHDERGRLMKAGIPQYHQNTGYHYKPTDNWEKMSDSPTPPSDPHVIKECHWNPDYSGSAGQWSTHWSSY